MTSSQRSVLSAFSPRVVGRNRPDFHSLETLLGSPQFAGKTGEELVLAIYNHFAGKVDGTYHFWPSDEHKANPRIRRANADPVKMLNVYGWAICGQCASILYGLYRAAGLEARIIGLPGHVLCEVFYDGRWHILDVDMWTWFRTPQGHLAGAFELTRDSQRLILDNRDKSDPCDLPDRRLEDYAAMYAKTETIGDSVKNVYPRWAIRAHTMDFRLRPGETLIRSQEKQGRFHMPLAWKKEFAKRYASEWVGHPRERYEPFRTFGNGRWIYRPDLTDAAEDFPAGLWEPTRLTQDANGLLGPGSATMRIYSPYIFCGRPNWEGEGVTAADGVWLTLAGSGEAQVQIDQPDGSWATVFAADGPFDRTLDVTQIVDGRYDCLIRISLGAGGRLKRFGFEGCILTAPLSLPRLSEGENPMELRCRDESGLPTVPWSEVIDFRQSADPAKRWLSAGNAQLKPYVEGWQMVAPAADGPVSLTYRFDAPAGRAFAWAYVHATVREGPTDQPPRVAALEWSKSGRAWKTLARADIPNTPLQWDSSLDGKLRLDKPAGKVFVRVASDTPVCGLEFHGHLLEPECPQDELVVTHRWREGQKECTFRAPRGKTRYTITCGPDPSAHTIEMHCPSRMNPRNA